MLTLEEIGQSVRNNIQLILDNVQLPLAVGPISDDDYRILSGGYGQLEWDYALATYGNDPSKFELCIKFVSQGTVQSVPAGAALCLYGIENKAFSIHMIERFTNDEEDHPLNGRMVLITLMSAYMFCKAVECNEIRIVEPVPELVPYYASFGFETDTCGYVMFAETTTIESVFLKFAQLG
ncbi:TPA: hypothetical protein MNC29_001130 [Citrobacter freundii]|uniref:hypothetical protein n=1 Tax=Citrobacter freundii TaxID=546 RepID=UPI001406CA9E|nr:hypothetical protein [Citrobacter freundii]ECD9475084.1 hypothetical protein [Salmonella enterica subsp. houtenae]EDS8694756.1 hypothetical protein [Salmonella enterica]EDV2388659.1 hypothetical protein [Salmonella enterica subsp. enterica serovar Miami]EIN8658627.1 hypothetical protein [Citrobacter freundii]HBZ9065830.1 hypothetical protein [Citrobacter freundii]